MRTIVLEGRGPNTMSTAMLERLLQEILDAGDEPILITGAGSAFSSGLDLDALERATADEVAALLDTMERATRALFLYPGPVVAAINGHAIAGGCLLAQCADVRVGVDDERARFGMTGVVLGLVYPPFVPAVFRARVPIPHAETVLLGAERFGPKEAARLGLLDELAPPERVRQRAEELLAARARLPRAAYAAIKRAFREPAYADVLEAQRRFSSEAVASWTDGIAAARRARRGAAG